MGNHITSPIPYEDKRSIEKMIKEERTFPFMAKVLNRSKYSIRNEVQRNGGREVYSAARSEKRKKEGIKRLREHWVNLKTGLNVGQIAAAPMRELRDKIGALEAQLQIVTELIMEEYD